MLTTTTVIARIRSSISDNNEDSSQYTFQDTELQDFLSEAVTEYSGYRPYLEDYTVTTISGQDTYSLPADACWIINVTWNANTDLAYLYNIYSYDFYNTWVNINEMSLYDRALITRRNDALALFSEIGAPVWEIYNGELRLLPAPNDDGQIVTVSYGAIHTTDQSGNYPTIPTQDVPLILRLLEARLLDVMATLFSLQGDYVQGQTTMKHDEDKLRQRAAVLRAQVQQALDEGVAMRG